MMHVNMLKHIPENVLTTFIHPVVPLNNVKAMPDIPDNIMVTIKNISHFFCIGGIIFFSK